jgi:putative MATE family efflux protein
MNISEQFINTHKHVLRTLSEAAANQVFSSAFWVVSVLPSVTATLVSKANARGNKDDVQDAVSQALVVGFLISIVGTALMMLYPEKVLSMVLKEGSPALQYARPYLFVRSFAFLPSLLSLIGFSAFRGTLDTSTPLKISAASNVFNAVLDPVLMFTMNMGVTGAALATLAAEVISAASFLSIMLRRKMVRWSKILRLPSYATLKPLLEGGAALQMRNVALNVTFLMVARVTQSLDNTGVAAAAHAMAIQVFQLGGIVLLALSTVAQTIVPNELIEKVDAVTGKLTGGKRAAKNVVNRLMSWGFVLGIFLGGLQLLLLPVLQKSSPLEAVREAAVIPSILASVYQMINGLVFIGEGEYGPVNEIHGHSPIWHTPNTRVLNNPSQSLFRCYGWMWKFLAAVYKHCCSNDCGADFVKYATEDVWPNRRLDELRCVQQLPSFWCLAPSDKVRAAFGERPSKD